MDGWQGVTRMSFRTGRMILRKFPGSAFVLTGYCFCTASGFVRTGFGKHPNSTRTRPEQHPKRNPTGTGAVSKLFRTKATGMGLCDIPLWIVPKGFIWMQTSHLFGPGYWLPILLFYRRFMDAGMNLACVDLFALKK